jgi:RNA polymerase sigma-70 factor (ECF subfamily)
MAASLIMDQANLHAAEESALALRFAREEPGAFEEVVAVYQHRVARLASRLLGWKADIDDLVQDVFLAALTGARGFGGKALLWTWLTTITLNRCRRHLRKRALWERFWSVAQHAAAPTAPASDAPTLGAELSQQVRAAVAALPPRDREIIVLFYLEGHSADEIARLTGNTANAVQIRLHRARGKLSDSLSPLAKD